MDVNTTANAAKAGNYDSASNAEKTGKTGKTGKHEAPHAPSYAPKEKKEDGITNPEDTVEISEAAQNGEKVKGKEKSRWKDFDMDAFQSGIRDKLMESIHKSKEELRNSGVEFAKADSSSLLYNLSELKDKDVKAADVPEYWNAENTSQRIVDFAMSFKDMATGISSEEYVEQMRKAVQKGFALAQKALGDLPGASAKLYNDTYNLTMKKFDDILEQMRKGKDVDEELV